MLHMRYHVIDIFSLDIVKAFQYCKDYNSNINYYLCYYYYWYLFTICTYETEIVFETLNLLQTMGPLRWLSDRSAVL